VQPFPETEPVRLIEWRRSVEGNVKDVLPKKNCQTTLTNIVTQDLTSNPQARAHFQPSSKSNLQSGTFQLRKLDGSCWCWPKPLAHEFDRARTRLHAFTHSSSAPTSNCTLATSTTRYHSTLVSHVGEELVNSLIRICRDFTHLLPPFACPPSS
jgi:hypothetical protein